MKKTLSIGLFFLVIVLMACNQAPESATAESEVEPDQDAYLEKGKSIAGATFTALSSELQMAMQEGGVANAVSYCQLNAYPLVDSLSKAHQAEIRRTTLKVRNPKDAPTMAEQNILKQYAAMEAAGETLLPMVKVLDNQEVAFFAPIRTNAFCLQCHGVVGETLKTENYAVIKEYYPNDQAVGYQEGDLRGMWSIRFKDTSK